jgi:hypothetical protein
MLAFMRILPVAIAFVVVALSARARNLQAPCAADPRVQSGTLSNGMRYFIFPNARPAQRAELRLAVRVGSTVEREDQRGLAHFVEHMSFNGSEHFAPGEVASYLQSVGAEFGADTNAYCGGGGRPSASLDFGLGSPHVPERTLGSPRLVRLASGLPALPATQEDLRRMAGS